MNAEGKAEFDRLRDKIQENERAERRLSSALKREKEQARRSGRRPDFTSAYRDNVVNNGPRIYSYEENRQHNVAWIEKAAMSNRQLIIVATAGANPGESSQEKEDREKRNEIRSKKTSLSLEHF